MLLLLLTSVKLFSEDTPT